MKSAAISLIVGLLIVGCSGEPSPKVGDAEISKGIARRPMPKPPQGMSATSGLTSRDVEKMRSAR